MYLCSQPSKEMHTTGAKLNKISDLPPMTQERLAERNLLSHPVSSVISVTVHERTIDVGCALVVSAFDDDLPQFAEVTEILICSNRLFIFAKLLERLEFDYHFHAYKVRYLLDNIIFEDFNHMGMFHDLMYVSFVNDI